MPLDAELFALLFYALQQLGVMLGVGSETIILLAYLLSMRDGVIEQTEERFARAIGKVLNAGLILIALSGLGVVSLHFMSREFDILLEPVFLFKWLLIVILITLAVLVQKKAFSQDKLQMFAGGTWYALFIIHILAPITTWANLFILYGAWLIGFSLCWYALSHFTRVAGVAQPTSKLIEPEALRAERPKLPPPPPPKPTPPPPPPKPAPPPPPPPPPKPVAPPPPPPPKPAPPAPKPLPSVAHTQLLNPGSRPDPFKPTPHLNPIKPVIKIDEKVKDPDESPFLPAIRVMPQTPEDVEKHNRASIVKFE